MFLTPLVNFGRTLIKNDYVRAQLLAIIRHGLTVGGTFLASWGWIAGGPESAKAEDAIAGAAVVMLVQYFSQLDVKGVAEKVGR